MKSQQTGYSNSVVADFLRKREMPEYASGRAGINLSNSDVDRYAARINPRRHIPMGVGATMAERDAGRWMDSRPPEAREAGSGLPGGLAQPMRGSGSALSGAPERPPSDMAAMAPAGAPPSSWSGAMSPITLRPGVGLMEMKPRFGAYMRDEPVLAARRAEFDRNLGNYLKDRPPTWQSRAEYEREIAGLAGAGEEILPHIQQRAYENMPVRLAQDWQAEEAERKASEQALITSRARSAAEQDWLNRAPPGARKAFEQNYISTPSGFKRIGMTPWEKSEAGYEEFRRTATPEEMAEFHKNYEQTPMGWRRKWIPGQDAVESTSDRPPSGAPPAGASVVVPPQRPAEFRTEAEAVAAGLPPGTKVFINGRPAIIE